MHVVASYMSTKHKHPLLCVVGVLIGSIDRSGYGTNFYKILCKSRIYSAGNYWPTRGTDLAGEWWTRLNTSTRGTDLAGYWWTRQNELTRGIDLAGDMIFLADIIHSSSSVLHEMIAQHKNSITDSLKRRWIMNYYHLLNDLGLDCTRYTCDKTTPSKVIHNIFMQCTEQITCLSTSGQVWR